MSGASRCASVVAIVLLVLGLSSWASCEREAFADAGALHVGSKRFTESYVLGEIVRAAAASANEANVVHDRGLGNTGIVFEALQSGSIDVYPEYTGTIAKELLGGRASAHDLEALNRELAPLGLAVGVALGFNDTYALAMSSARARELGVTSISELARKSSPSSELRFGFSQEFLERSDGWPVVARAYGFRAPAPRGLDHGLAYEAITHGELDVTDVYSTDAKIEKLGLVVLDDDKAVFPRYDAVLLFRKDLPTRLPRAWAKVVALGGTISDREMTRMNADAELRGVPFAAIAEAFVAGKHEVPPEAARATLTDRIFGSDFVRLTVEHVTLVFVSVLLAAFAGVPLGIWAATRRERSWWPRVVLGSVGVVQTIPSLALLAFLIPLLHRIGTVPALVALFAYALLPIVQGTYTGLVSIAPSLRESALSLGLPRLARLRLIELPLAARSIASGVKTSAVINVGTATIAAFIGAGGYGERIAAGLALNDDGLLLAGAIPSAALALLMEGVFGMIEKKLA
jgi:osmoprotectant transport system permease protein